MGARARWPGPLGAHRPPVEPAGARQAAPSPGSHTGPMGSESMLDRRPALRWLAPGAALMAIAGIALVRPAVADASTGLEALTARQLLVKAQQARPAPMSGTITQRFDLGLPDLPRSVTGNPGTASLASLVSGSHTWRVWYGDPQHARLALIGQSSESDIVRNGENLWVWSSSEKTARQYVLPPSAAARSGSDGTSPGGPAAAQRQAHRESLTAHGLPDPADPGAVADWALRQVDPTTSVETTTIDRVAGRSVYGLVLTPKQSNSLIASVRLALDGETFLPLSVQVNSTKQDKPAIDVAYSDVSFDKPDSSVFDFSPPAGTEVTRTDLSDPATRPKSGAPGHAGPARAGAHGKTGTPSAKAASPYRPVVTGTGWERIVAGRMPKSRPADGTATGSPPPQEAMQEFTALLPELPGGGGRVLDGTLFSAVLTDDGRFAVGPVAPQALNAALPAR